MSSIDEFIQKQYFESIGFINVIKGEIIILLKPKEK